MRFNFLNNGRELICETCKERFPLIEQKDVKERVEEHIKTHITDKTHIEIAIFDVWDFPWHEENTSYDR